MISIDLKNKTVLITGGTQGIGKASAKELALAGARVYVTCKWGSADPEELEKEFSQAGANPPVVLEADVSNEDDTDTLMEQLKEKESSIDIFVSNVGFAPQVSTLEEYKKRSFFKTLEYSSWPIVEYTQKIKDSFGSYPKRVIAVSSDGPDHYYRGYDYVAAAKAMLEHFARYLSVHLLKEGSRVNVVRFGTVKTRSFSAIFGEEFFTFFKNEGIPEELILTPEDCGKTILALVSGLMDTVNGQVITADYGLPFQDNTMMRFLTSRKNQTEEGTT